MCTPQLQVSKASHSIVPVTRKI
ncbi:hypothetical protein B4U80_03487 [Leptotrombidium deliense]|uniref:Uncharacterized protein n=1 Tax=Leptotrombidium deliense TaxID=299467 RepID=A0A443S2Z2_9ACAR|nr:hypothetical protein B4U80_03487 [Leptotrombidium deliense]